MSHIGSQWSSNIRAWLIIGSLGVLLLVNGCGTVLPRNPLPAELEPSAQIPGIPQARIWGDAIPSETEERLRTLTTHELQQEFPALYRQPHNYLAISGGGAEGAFGAGLLVGWTEAGDRPEFQMVTGVSTGALIAPFAFLGPAYDDVLREVYTATTTDDILRVRPWLSIIFSDAAANATPLLELIRRHVDDDVIAAIATEYRRGRRLFIGTTDLDHMRPRIWDIGAISASGAPGAKDLVHNIMLASAAIPGAFPPVRIEVTAEGATYDELHVDGGTTAQVFVYPATIDWRTVLDHFQVPGAHKIFVIRNSKLTPRPEVTEPRLVPIAGRSISSLIRTQGIGDLYLIFMLALRDGGDFNLAYIPSAFDKTPDEFFDKAYMNALFDLGYRMSKKGYPWRTSPPGWVNPRTNGVRLD